MLRKSDTENVNELFSFMVDWVLWKKLSRIQVPGEPLTSLSRVSRDSSGIGVKGYVIYFIANLIVKRGELVMLNTLN